MSTATQRFAAITLATALIGCTTTTEDPPPDTGPSPTYNTPESVVWDVSNNAFYVANIAGDSSEADGVGWIARLDADGNVENSRWVDNLNAPKGMAVVDDRLYVADLTEVLEIDTDSGEILRHIAVPGAIFLNDITAGNDKVWISDTFGAAVYQLSPADGDVSILAQDAMLASINGLAFDGNQIVGGTTGDFVDLDDLGHLVTISLSGEVEILYQEVGKIDGLIHNGDTFLATDFRGMLLEIGKDGTVTELQNLVATHGMSSAADLGFDPARQLIAIPDLFASQVVFIELNTL